MKKKLILSIVAAVAVVAVCGTLVFTHIKKSNGEVDLKETNKLKVYVLKDDQYINYIFSEFNKYYPDINVEKVTFDNEEQYKSQLQKDATKKGGPDVIFEDRDQYVDLRKMQMNDQLVDLKPLLQKDKDFVFEDYNDAVFNSCSYDGKLTAIPFSYSVPAFYAGGKSFDGGTLKKEGTLKDFTEAALKSGESRKSVFSSRNYIYQMVAASGVDFIDYKNKKLINEDKLKEFMDDCKKLYSKEITKMNSMKGVLDGIKDKSITFADFMPGASMVASTVTDSAYKQYANDTANIYAVPSLKGGNEYYSVSSGPLFIPKAAENKKSALDFIEMCLSSPIQSQLATSQYIPVRIEDYINGFKTARQQITGMQPVTDEKGNQTSESLQLDAISDDLNKATKDVINQAKKCRYMDNNSYGIIFDEIGKYVSSDLSKDKALAEIRDGINKYFKN